MSALLTGGLALLEVAGKLLEKVIPDPEARARAQLELLRLQQEGNLKELEVQMSAILAEAKSSDPWTSRARPSFMYVVYILILAALPMGIVSAVSTSTAADISLGMKDWLGGIPPNLIDLFQWVMLGYVGARSVEKVRGVSK